MSGEIAPQKVLEAARAHLAARRVCTLATSHQDRPWAASSFYVARELDIYICQRADARTLQHLRANPRVAFAVDDREARAWLQAAGAARVVTGEEEAWARDRLTRAAPEFERHFASPDYPVLRIETDEITFVDRQAGIVPRRHLVRVGGQWRLTG